MAWKRDAERLDWLADPDSDKGGVYLSTEFDCHDLPTVRGALDVAMEKGNDHRD